MKAKKIFVLISVLVCSLNSRIFSFEFSCSNYYSLSHLKVSDCSNLGLSTTTSFRAGANNTNQKSVFAFFNFEHSDQLVSQKAFKSPGDSLSLSLGMGLKKQQAKDTFFVGTGLDLLYLSSCSSRVYVQPCAELGFEKYYFTSIGIDTCLCCFVHGAWEKDILALRAGIGVNVKTEISK